jgi:ubiquinone/menaquinone biosynthesis C-methylase UbiE
MKQEFDLYINNYRPNLDNALALSGETSIFFAKYKAEKLAEWLPHLCDKKIRILDFGCGDGMMTSFVSSFFPQAEMVGVDPSPKSIEAARSSYPNILFAVNSDESTILDYPSKSFDVVFAAGAFHHIPFHLHAGYLSELVRVAKTHGTLVLFELNPYNPLTVLTFKRNTIDKDAHLMKPGYTRALCQNYGSTQIKFYCFFPRFLKSFRFLERFMTKLPLGALYAAIVKKRLNG